jgi:hypothetical protein
MRGISKRKWDANIRRRGRADNEPGMIPSMAMMPGRRSASEPPAAATWGTVQQLFS